MTASLDPVHLHTAAVDAWRSVGPDRVIGGEVLAHDHKSSVVRMRLDSTIVPTIVAKRSSVCSVSLEEKLYTGVLPHYGIRATRCFGVAPDADDSLAWLFLEDIPGQWQPKPGHQALAARFLAGLHVAARSRSGCPELPERGSRVYLAHVLSARERLLQRLEADASEHRDGETVLLRGVQLCSEIANEWDEVDRYVRTLPTVLVHGDFSPENLRIRDKGGRQTLYAIDWEKAGWGPPPVDLAWVDLGAYGAITEHLDLSRAGARASIQSCAVLLRGLSHDWARKPHAKVERYVERIHASWTAFLDARRAGEV